MVNFRLLIYYERIQLRKNQVEGIQRASCEERKGHGISMPAPGTPLSSNLHLSLGFLGFLLFLLLLVVVFCLFLFSVLIQLFSAYEVVFHCGFVFLFLLAGDAEHLHTHLLAIYISFFVR